MQNFKLVFSSLQLGLILIASFSPVIQAQQPSYGIIDSVQLPSLYPHKQKELLLDYSIEPQKWKDVKNGLNVSVVSTNEVFFRSEVPELEQTSHVYQTTAWRGEKVNFELLVWSADSLQQVNLVVNDLIGNGKNSISKNNCKSYLIRYVISNYPYNSNQSICGEGPRGKGYLIPDRFEDFKMFDLPARTVRPIWISTSIPCDTKADLYKSSITVTCAKESVTIPIEIKVQNHELPHPKKWKYRLDLWQNPSVISEHFQVEPWSEEFKLLLYKNLQLYADAGGKYITTYAVHSPWADNSYYIEESMIKWIKKKDGSWQFDYSIFDEYVELAHSAGITEAITVYTLVPWGDRFIYFDENTNRNVTEAWQINSDVYKKNINAFLTDLKTHLISKEWFSKTFLGINENELQQTLDAIKIIKENDRAWKITYAGYWHSELDSLLDDYSCQVAFEPTASNIRNRANKGQFTTTYVCCVPAKPNNLLYSPPIESRWISWLIEAKGYNGFLRWALDSWPADPNRDARHLLWPAGDSFLIYPGGKSSVRFEKLREGISDFEKIKIIEALVKKSSDAKIKNLWHEFENNRQSILTENNYDKNDLEKMVNKGVNLINQLSDLLEKD